MLNKNRGNQKCRKHRGGGQNMQRAWDGKRETASNRSISGITGYAVTDTTMGDPDHLSGKDLLPTVKSMDSSLQLSAPSGSVSTAEVPHLTSGMYWARQRYKGPAPQPDLNGQYSFLGSAPGWQGLCWSWLIVRLIRLSDAANILFLSQVKIPKKHAPQTSS